MAFVFSLFLPKVKTSIYFHQNGEGSEEAQETRQGQNQRSLLQVMMIMIRDALKAFKNPYVLKWSIWVWLSTCMNVQIGNYIQSLWEDILPSTEPHNDTSLFDASTIAPITTTPGTVQILFVKIENLNKCFQLQVTTLTFTMEWWKE